MQMSHPDLVPTSEAARRLGVCPTTLRTWRRIGVGPAWHDVGTYPRYHVKDIEAFLASRRRVGPRDAIAATMRLPQENDREIHDRGAAAIHEIGKLLGDPNPHMRMGRSGSHPSNK
jgi:hypothetical protein